MTRNAMTLLETILSLALLAGLTAGLVGLVPPALNVLAANEGVHRSSLAWDATIRVLEDDLAAFDARGDGDHPLLTIRGGSLSIATAAGDPLTWSFRSAERRLERDAGGRSRVLLVGVEDAFWLITECGRYVAMRVEFAEGQGRSHEVVVP